ncbi:unnamed protein product [Ectocarpus fasciculatus]
MASVMAGSSSSSSSSSSSIDVTAGGKALRAAGDIDIALLELQRHLDEEVAKATPAAATAAGETGEAPAEATEVIKGDPLLHALLRCSRQLTKLRHSLLAQADVARESIQRRGRPVAVTNEGRKAQSTLLHAQQIADDMYHGSLAQLNDPFSAETGYHSKVLDTVQSCDRANAVTASALTLVISALSGFPPPSSAPVASGSGSTADAGAGDYGDSGDPAESRTEGRPSSLATPLGNSSSPERIGTGDAGRPVAAAAAAAAGAGAGAAAAAASGGERGASGSAGGGRKNSGAGVYRNQGIPRAGGGSVRSCRSQAAAAAGVGGLWRAGRNTGVERGTRVGGARSAAVAAWGAAPPKATATEMAVSLGLAPVTRREVAAAAEDRKRRAASSLRVAMSGAGAGGAEGVEGYAKAGGGGTSTEPSAAGRQEAAIFRFGSGKPSPVERQRRRQQQPATSSVEASRRDRPPTSAAWLDGAASGDWLTDKSGEGVSSPAATQEAAGALGRPSSSARGPAAAAAPAMAAASSRRVASGHRSPSGSLVSARLTSPERLRSAGRTALDVRRRLVAAGSGSGSSSSERRRRSAAAAAAVRNRGGPPDSDEERLVNALFDEASYRAILDNVPAANGSCPLDEERLANALFDEASYRALLGERPTLTGSQSPPRSLSTPRAVALRRGMIGFTPPAGPGRGGRGPGRWDTPSTPLENDGRSQGDGRLLSSAPSQVFRPREASAAAAAAAAAALAEPPRGMDEDEAAARRFAAQEQEAQAREDELLALRLAAREEAGAERRRASRRRVQRRGNASSARRNSAPGYISPDSNHPAVALGWDDPTRGEGAAVSDAVRALQFQDIDENDFETLLALDEAGGEGGRCCAGGKGLTEEAMEAVLQTGTAAGARLEESCAVCMEEFGLGDEVSVLPCLHAFHGACIRKWLVMRNRCPTCLKAVIPDSPQAK